MKTRNLSLAVTAVATALLASSSVYAVDDFFTGSVDSSFTNAGNYTPQLVIGTNRQVFNLATAGNAGLSVTVPATATPPANPGVNGAAPSNIAFDTDAGSYTFTGGRLLFQSNGGVLFNLLATLNGTPTITVNNEIQDFNARNSRADLTITNGKSGASLILNGNIVGGATIGQSVGVAFKAASQNAALTITQANGIISDGTSGGNTVVTRTGGGGTATQLFLNGANTYSGGFEFGNGSGLVSAGNKSAFGTGAIRLIESGGMTIQSGAALTGANAVTNTVNFVSGAFAANTTANAVLSFTTGSNTATLVSGTAPAVGDSVRAGNGAVLPINVRVIGVSGSTITFDANAIGTNAAVTLTTAPINSAGTGTIIYGGTNDIELSGTQNLTTVFSNGFAGTDTFQVTNTGLTTFSGTLQQQGGVASVAKTGAGRLVLSGSNTYGGTTAVTAGTLFVNNTAGSGTGAGAVSVAATATLGGTGTIAGAVSTVANSNIAPGFATIGTLSVGSATIAGNLLEELGGATGDRLTDAGALTLSGTSALTFSTLTPLTAASYIIASYGSLTGTFGTVTGTPTGYTLSYGTGTNSVISLISTTAVPEPAALGAIAAASTMLLRRRRAAAK